MRLSAASEKAITFHLATQDGEAMDGVQYLGRAQTITFDPGVVGQIFSVPTLVDALFGAKNFYLNVSDAHNVTLGASSAVGVVQDNRRWVEGHWVGHYELQDVGSLVWQKVGDHRRPHGGRLRLRLGGQLAERVGQRLLGGRTLGTDLSLKRKPP